MELEAGPERSKQKELVGENDQNRLNACMKISENIKLLYKNTETSISQIL